MTSALRLDAGLNDADRKPILPSPRYAVVGKLRSHGRAEVAVCLPNAAQRVADLVVVKTFAAEAIKGSAELRDLPHELQLASVLHHDNIVATLGIGYEAGNHFVVSEYLEGTTLRRLLRWLGSRSERLPSAAVVRILLGIFAAVEHGHRWARGPAARALVHRVIAAEDVFITYGGDVKLLGFKSAAAVDATEPPDHPSLQRAAVDALLSTQLSPELAALLARVGSRVSPASMLGLWQIARALHTWQAEELKSDGRAELAAVMAGVLPGGRATRRALLEAACERAIRARQPINNDGPSIDEPPPVSGYRMVHSDATIAVGPGPSAIGVTSSLATVARQTASTLPAVAASDGSAARNLAGRRRASWTARRGLAVLVLGGLLGLSVHALRSAPGTSASLASARPPLPPAPGADATSSVIPNGSVPPSAPAALATPETPTPSSDIPADRSLPREPSSGRWKVGEKPRPGSSRGGQAPARSGYLTLDTTPWSAVSLGGTALGHTPLVKLELPPGQHELALENEELGIVSSVLVDIVSDVTTVRRIGLERPLQATSR